MSAGPYEYDENDLRSMHENMTPAEVYRSIENFRLYGEMVEGMDRVDSDSSTVEQHSAVQEGIAAGAAAAAPALSPAGASMDIISVDSGSRHSEPEPVGEAEGTGSGANLHAPDVPDEGRVEVVWTPEMDYMLLLEVGERSTNTRDWREVGRGLNDMLAFKHFRAAYTTFEARYNAIKRTARELKMLPEYQSGAFSDGHGGTGSSAGGHGPESLLMEHDEEASPPADAGNGSSSNGYKRRRDDEDGGSGGNHGGQDNPLDMTS